MATTFLRTQVRSPSGRLYFPFSKWYHRRDRRLLSAMDAAASAPQAGYDALVRQLSRQLSLSSESDDAPVNLADLPAELLALILYRLLLAHDIAQLAPLCSALRDAAQLVFVARPYSCLLYTSPSPRD